MDTLEPMTVVDKQDIEAIANGFMTLAMSQNYLHRAKAESGNGGTGVRIPFAPPTKDDVSALFTAFVSELMEWANEADWKRWKPAKERDPQAGVGEAADVVAFFGEFICMTCEAFGVSIWQIVQAYAEKTQTNFDRFTGRIDAYNFNKVRSENEA